MFAAALDIADPAERARYLAEACSDNPTLRQEVESLLAAHEQAGGFMESRPTLVANGLEQNGVSDTPTAAEKEGDRIGPFGGLRASRYTLLEQIGEGGFGTVWMAVQNEPVHRRVALKIIKLGMDTRQVVARFEAERQALALMTHPNIAQVFDKRFIDPFLPPIPHGIGDGPVAGARVQRPRLAPKFQNHKEERK